MKVGKYRLKIRPKILSEKEIAHLGIFSAFENVDDSHWVGLRFVESGDHDILQRFYEKFEKFHGIDSDAIRDRHTDTTPEGGTHPDDELIEYTSAAVLEYLPHLSTLLFAHDAEKNDDSKS